VAVLLANKPVKAFVQNETGNIEGKEYLETRELRLSR